MVLSIRDFSEELLTWKIWKSMVRDDFQRFMNVSNYAPRFENATAYVWKTPKIADRTLRDWFNEVILWKPHFCGKEHEIPGKYREPDTCPHHNQPMCGHPEMGLFYPVLALSWYIASKVDAEITHPGAILEEHLILDMSAGWLYSWAQMATEHGVKWSEVDIPDDPQWSIIEEERQAWESIIKPYLDRVSSIIRGIK